MQPEYKRPKSSSDALPFVRYSGHLLTPSDILNNCIFLVEALRYRWLRFCFQRFCVAPSVEDTNHTRAVISSFSGSLIGEESTIIEDTSRPTVRAVDTIQERWDVVLPEVRLLEKCEA